MSKQLAHPPLVEALLEVKWNLKKVAPDTFQDPGFKWASGRLYDKIKKRFGYIKDLSAAMVPEELTPFAVRHQFRAQENGWPLVQLGPGIASINFTPPYSWIKFKDVVKFFIPNLVSAYSGVVTDQSEYQLVLNSTILRYINAVELEWDSENVLDFLSSRLHTNYALPDNIVNSENIIGQPSNINSQIGYKISNPPGQILIRFSTGVVGQKKGLILELIFVSTGEDCPQITEINDFMNWLTAAHDVIEKSFFTLIDGELKNQFK